MFLHDAALWLLLQAEFLAIALVLVYVGAVMVLFLFVVMMLDIKTEPLREGFIRYLPVGVAGRRRHARRDAGADGHQVDVRLPAPADPGGASNTAWLGKALFTQFPAAVRSRGGDPDRRRHRRGHADAAPSHGTRNQNPAAQVAVKASDRVRIVKMASVPPSDAGTRVRNPAMITLAHYIVLGAILFCISVAGIFINRKNVIVLLMAIELMLLAVNMNFVAFSRFLGDVARAGVRVLHPDRGGGGIGDRPGDPGRAVPQPRDDQRRRNGFDERLTRF